MSKSMHEIVQIGELFQNRNQPYMYLKLGGGFKYFLFSSLFGEDSHFDQYFSDGLKPPTRKYLVLRPVPPTSTAPTSRWPSKVKAIEMLAAYRSARMIVGVSQRKDVSPLGKGVVKFACSIKAELSLTL